MRQPYLLIGNGDLRLSANQKTWAAQQRVEAAVSDAVASFGGTVKRAHGIDPVEGHGFIKSQKHGMEVFRQIPRRTSDRGRSCLAIQPPHSERSDVSSGPNSDGS